MIRCSGYPAFLDWRTEKLCACKFQGTRSVALLRLHSRLKILKADPKLLLSDCCDEAIKWLSRPLQGLAEKLRIFSWDVYACSWHVPPLDTASGKASNAQFPSLCSDIPMKQFIVSINDQLPNAQKFIIYDLDDTHLFVQPHVADMLQNKVKDFLDKITYEKPA
jgi:TFIIH basal transcription factor complex TTD-A subunit